ncbi:MAG: histidine phosphatase family protein [Thermodesulfobacteriota bacterium]|jgi:probable phosphoglycerate mutase
MVNNIESSGTRILLIRHGETDWNRIRRFQGRSDLPLNQKGKDQAHALALALKDESLTAIYSSPLIRTLETARLIKVFHPSIPLFEEEGLVEMNLGEFEGMEAQRWAAEYPDFLRTWQETPASVTMPGGESLQEVQTRAIGTLERITKLYPTESTLLLCSHNFVNLTMLCYALRVPLDRFREVRQETAALNVLYMQGQRLWAKVVNERSYLKRSNGSEAK